MHDGIKPCSVKTLKEALVEYFRGGIKTDGKKCLGVEIEHFVLDKETDESLPFSGERGVETILRDLIKHYPDAVPITHNDDLLGFSVKGFVITLEPAAQLEISIAPNEMVAPIEKIYREFRNTADAVLDKYGCYLASVGGQPVSRVDDLKLIPKERYYCMDRYFKEKGTRGIEMMRGSASTQVSVDFFSEEDFKRKIRAAYLMTPIFQLLAENCSVFEGRPVNSHLKRVSIWRNTDNDRSGIPECIFDGDCSMESYADYVCNTPLILKQKGDTVEYTGSLTAARVYSAGACGDDAVHAASMVFPDVRLKTYLEIRGADSLPAEKMMAYAALIKGSIYSEYILEECSRFTEENAVRREDVIKAQDSLMKDGWDGEVYGIPIKNAALHVLDSAREELPDSERHYLDPFYDLIN